MTLTLDPSYPQVLIDFFNDAHGFQWHARLLVVKWSVDRSHPGRRHRTRRLDRPPIATFGEGLELPVGHLAGDLRV